jgi:hypothetical protein
VENREANRKSAQANSTQLAIIDQRNKRHSNWSSKVAAGGHTVETKRKSTQEQTQESFLHAPIPPNQLTSSTTMEGLTADTPTGNEVKVDTPADPTPIKTPTTVTTDYQRDQCANWFNSAILERSERQLQEALNNSKQTLYTFCLFARESASIVGIRPKFASIMVAFKSADPNTLLKPWYINSKQPPIGYVSHLPSNPNTLRQGLLRIMIERHPTDFMDQMRDWASDGGHTFYWTIKP